nr:uncharacterized protein LOC113713943 [Coffea arabica]
MKSFSHSLTWTKNEDELSVEIASYYRELFKTSDANEMEEVLNGIPHTISGSMNANLTKPVDEGEIRSALFSMNPDKAPGVDGMPPIFFQKFWNIVKKDLVGAVQTFFHTSHLLKSVNHTAISLIPKILIPTSLKHYRPISLCTTVYKIIAKILANRLKQVLHACISKTQSAFVPGRQILDNIMISHEFLHFLKNKRQGKEGFMAVKLDMSKAYDRVEWGFLDAVMRKMGFNDKWRSWIMECISTASYSFLVNGEVKEYVVPQRGIRQGDPLSPYLFLLCSEGFSNLLQKAASEKRIEGMGISRRGPRLTHLFFADDSLIFCKADSQNAAELKRLLNVYERGTGQLINLEKSSVIFSNNMQQETKEEVSQALGNLHVVSQGKYLGLPMVVTRSKQQLFGYIKSSIQQRLKKWKNKLLSAAGKEIMLKSVALALPTYTMSCFKLPKKLCKEINSTMANYWWGEENGKNKIHWKAWNKISRDKKAGGLGFKDLEAFNLALLGKQIWRLLTQPNLLVSRVLKSRYHPKQSIFKCKVAGNASWIWKGLMRARQLVEEGTRKRIGNGLSTNIWEDNWIPMTPNGRVTTQQPQGVNLVKVADLIVQKRWNKNLLFRNFTSTDVEGILSIPISLVDREDNNFWIHNSNGLYSVRSAYRVLTEEPKAFEQELRGPASTSWSIQSQKIWKYLWKLNIKHKVKLFLWKCLNQALPVRHLIHSRTQQGDPICRVCGEECETVEHALLNCNHVKLVWRMATIQWEGITNLQGCFGSWWTAVMEARSRSEGDEHISLTANILWQIWKSRNATEFEGKQHPPIRIVQKAHEEWLEYGEANLTALKRSTEETGDQPQPPQQQEQTAGILRLRFAIEKSKDSPQMGIGATVSLDNQQLMRGWALRERCSGHKLIDELTAIKLLICKAAVQSLERLEVQVQDKQTLHLIQQPKSSDMRVVTLLEDIHNLKYLFRMCSFCLVNRDINHITHRISAHALDFFVDQEFWIHQ